MSADGKRAARLEAGVVSPCWSRPWAQGAPSDAREDRRLSPLASIMASCSLPHLARRKPKIRIASRCILAHLWPTSYRPRMQPAAHASDMNPNNGRTYCTVVHQPRVSLPSSSSSCLTPPSLGLDIRSSAESNRVESSPVEPSQHDCTAAAAASTSKSMFAAPQ